mmetsp:Transcript_30673/g.51652  ORF Transcript_30673/g.51652 Transcript_30673/m.51652 type:complete len:235 (-) Transcript_30673:629-1333(-)
MEQIHAQHRVKRRVFKRKKLSVCLHKGGAPFASHIRAPEAFPVVHVLLRLCQIERREVGAAGAKRWIAVAKERMKPACTASNLQNLCRLLVAPFHEVTEGDHRVPLHRVLSSHKQRLCARFVYHRGLIRQPSVGLIVEGMPVVRWVEVRVVHPHFRRGFLRFSLQGARRLLEEAQRLLECEERVELPVAGLHVERQRVQTFFDVPIILPIYDECFHKPPRSEHRRSGRILHFRR